MRSSAITAEGSARAVARPSPASVISMKCWQGWRGVRVPVPVRRRDAGKGRYAFVGCNPRRAEGALDIGIEGGGAPLAALPGVVGKVGHGALFMSASLPVARAYNRARGRASTGLSDEGRHTIRVGGVAGVPYEAL